MQEDAQCDSVAKSSIINQLVQKLIIQVDLLKRLCMIRMLFISLFTEKYCFLCNKSSLGSNLCGRSTLLGFCHDLLTLESLIIVTNIFPYRLINLC